MMIYLSVQRDFIVKAGKRCGDCPLGRERREKKLL
jgi:hypothetical protein